MSIKLRPHQAKAMSAIKSAVRHKRTPVKGRIVMPTGSGKTFIEASALKWQIARNTKNKTRIHLVLAPRIQLSKQLMEEYRKVAGLSYRAIAFHSGSHEPDFESGISWNEEATTSPSALQKYWELATNADQDVVVFSTYHSAHKLDGIQFDTMIADESQYCVSEGFYDSVMNIQSMVKLYFTATEKHTASSEGRGLNNEEAYGKVLAKATPAEMVAAGYIVPPRLHIMRGETVSGQEADTDKSIIDEVLNIAQKQDEITSQELGFSKILFAMKGTKDVHTISKNVSTIKESMPNHDVFTITSKDGARINGEEVTRAEFMDELKSAEGNALIFHYDILSEGIDIDGITGVALLRNMALAKMLQTIGRAVRIYKPNPSLKKYALISVSVINGDEDAAASARMYIDAIRFGGFDITMEEVVAISSSHEADEESIDDAYGNLKNNFNDLFLLNIQHDLETTEFLQKLGDASGDDEAVMDLLDEI